MFSKKFTVRFVVVLCSITIFPLLAGSQLPPSLCSPLGGKRADIISVQSAYRAPGGAAPTFTIPANATAAFVVVSSHQSVIASPTTDQNLSDEDFITINAALNFTTARSSGFLNFAQSTNPSQAETNLYSWVNLPFGAFASTQIAQGQSTPTLLNDVRFSVSGNTLTIAESNGNTTASYLVEFTSSTSNSLLENGFERVLMTGTTQIANTPIPANTNLIVISKKGTVRVSNTASTGGTEEGYADGRIVMDLDAATTNGYITVVNGANISFRSTYSIVNHPVTNSTRFLSSGHVIGDYTGKSTTSNSTNDVGIADPAIYVSGSNLVIDRSTAYRNNFDDVYVIEFYRRTGNPMSVEFIETQSQFIPSGQGSTSGTDRVFNIPAGAEYVILRQAGNANNSVNPHNENAMAAYAVIDLKNETATGYFYQQVGFSGQTTRRDDNYGFKNLPLNGTSSRNPSYSQGIYFTNGGGSVYDLRFTLSANKSQLTVTNAFGLVAANYQVITNADFFGARPDFAFTLNVNSDFTYSNNGQCGGVAVNARLCNPGSGNSPGGIPVSFYDKDPTTDGTARLLKIDAFNQPLPQGQCANFIFNLDLKSMGINNPNVTLYAIANDNGSFVPGGVGNAVGTPFTLASLSTQGGQYKECDYTNNKVAFTISGVMPCSDGTVFRDANGMTNNQIDGTGIGTIAGQPLYVNVLNASNTVVYTSTVNPTTGAFTAQPNAPGNFTFQLSINPGTVGQPAPIAALPANWVYTGENGTTGTGSDGTGNGLLPLTALTTSASVSTLFGIQQLPFSNNYTGSGWSNPGGNNVVNVPSAAFGGSDPEDGVYANNLLGRKVTLYPAVGGTLFYNGVPVNTATTVVNFDNDLVDIDPTAEGPTSASFTYAVWDNADFADATPALVNMGFGGILLPAVGLTVTATWNGQYPLLFWKTLAETNTHYFIIERSNNGTNFTAIATVKAVGQTNETSNYAYTDATAPTGALYYRVVLVDKDGSTIRSNIAALPNNASSFTGVQLWPNPATKNIHLYLPQKGTYTLQLVSPLGTIIHQQKTIVETGGVTVTIERNALPPGMYVLKIYNKQFTNALMLKVIFQ